MLHIWFRPKVYLASNVIWLQQRQQQKTKICCKAKFSPTVNTWGSPNAANRCNFTCKIPSIKKIKINNTKNGETLFQLRLIYTRYNQKYLSPLK